jgi:hypothetical protein
MIAMLFFGIKRRFRSDHLQVASRANSSDNSADLIKILFFVG